MGRKYFYLSAMIALSVHAAAPSGIDFNGDGIDDILVRNNYSGEVYTWLMNSDGKLADRHYVATIPAGNWRIEGTGDYNGDEITDILVRNISNGQAYIWLMNADGSRQSYKYVTTIPEADWQIAGTDSDFNGDGISDIVVRNRTKGWTYIWLMNADGSRQSYKYVTTIPEADWEIAGTDSDFNGDGVSDIVVRKKKNGEIYTWLMNADGSRESYRYITTIPEADWEIVGTYSDYNMDRSSDLTVRQRSNGATYTWLMSRSGARKTIVHVTDIPQREWIVEASGRDRDYDNTVTSLFTSLLAGKTFYVIGETEDGVIKFKIVFNDTLTSLTDTYLEGEKAGTSETKKILINGNRLMFEQSQDGSYTIIEQKYGDYIEFVDYLGDDTRVGRHLLFYDEEKANEYYAQVMKRITG
ncbi:FG-GAP repeat domain-containing protein [Hydrogenimonas sp.]